MLQLLSSGILSKKLLKNKITPKTQKTPKQTYCQKKENVL